MSEDHPVWPSGAELRHRSVFGCLCRSGNGEGPHPAESNNGEAVHDGAKVSQEIHGNSELNIIFFSSATLLKLLIGIR